MKRTSLHDVHVALGARMVDFGGWRMPVQYGPILDEARTVRGAGGLFDLGHMGRFAVEGPDAVRLVDRVATNHCAKIPAGAIRYALLCREDGYPIDDLLLYREEGEGVYLVVNASNTERDLVWIRQHGQGLDARVRDLTAASAMIALQGPVSQAVLQPWVEGCELSALRYYRFAFAEVCGMPGVRVSRTGYTGEDGFEVYFPAEEAPRVWNALLESGRRHGLAPVGLGARDTLRLEAGMPLYGHEIDEEHDPLEAGLAFGIAFTAEKGDFVGRAALERMRAHPKRRLMGITTPGPRVPRQGNRLLREGEEVGQVCSGSVSPTLGANIGSVYVRLGMDREGDDLELDVRGKRQACTLRELPFYSRTRKKT
jgi:aminomethyltransferase